VQSTSGPGEHIGAVGACESLAFWGSVHGELDDELLARREAL
jgi:hypothetical protein